jgi:aldehyde:ferredoxin oxidoreductase
VIIKGYRNRLIWCNLTALQIEVRDIAEDVLERFMGGVGLGTKILYDEGLKNKNLFDPDSLIAFMTGPLTGTIAPTSGRTAIVAVSPATSSYGESDIGGTWGVALKRAGYDGIVIHGQASRPVYLRISAEEIKIGDANILWGQDTFETTASLKDQLGNDSNIMCIGPAGERLSNMAGIFSDGEHARVAGRGGLGAVMGAKKLKAMAVFGSKTPLSIFDEQGLRDRIKCALPEIQKRSKALSDYGTPGGLLSAEESGDLPIRNWSVGSWREGALKISGDVVSERLFKKKFFCGSCVIGCGRSVECMTAYGNIKGGGPEYETLGSLGSNCLIDDIDAIAFGNDLCNRLGVDTLSCGSAIAFAMEAYEKGLITENDVGFKVGWGDARAMLRLVKEIGLCEGFGRLLGGGVKRASKEIGQGSERFAVHVKGLEPAMHDPRACASLGLAYATNPNGATHWPACNVIELKRVTINELGITAEGLSDRFSEEGKSVLTKKLQDYLTLFNSLKLCRFLVRLDPTEITNWFYMVTGIEHSLDSFISVGERITNLKKMCNIRLGLTRQDDRLPERIVNEKRRTGGAPEYLPNMEKMLPEYYQVRNWDDNGIPLPNKLDELDLKEEAKTLPERVSRNNPNGIPVGSERRRENNPG